MESVSANGAVEDQRPGDIGIRERRVVEMRVIIRDEAHITAGTTLGLAGGEDRTARGDVDNSGAARSFRLTSFYRESFNGELSMRPESNREELGAPMS